jgi:DNA-directed RNA polymerase specialized sigma24 family protein
MNTILTYETSERHIKAFGRRVLQRMRAAGAESTQLDDILGELKIAWCEARNRWNEAAGVPFGAYLYRGMRNHINRWVEHEMNVHNTAPFSIHKGISRDEDGEFEEVTEAFTDDLSAEEWLIGQDQARHFFAALTPDTRKLIELLISPPDFLVSELEKLQARSRYGRLRGIHSSSPKRLTMAFVMTAMGLTQYQRRQVEAEIQNALQQIGGAE